MLHAELRPHREYLLAQSPGQKLFLALKLRPQEEAASARPQLSVVFVVDTSGSMREAVTGARTKIEIVVGALKELIGSALLQPEDRLALVQFDDAASVLVPFTAAADRSGLVTAAESLRRYSGGTHMGAGMEQALALLEGETGSRRMIVLTDGQTFDESLVRDLTDQLAQKQIPVTAIGVGTDWNEDLLTHLTDSTQGKPYHVVPDNENPQPPSLRASELPQAILGELKQAATEVVTNVALSVRMVKDVKLERITRVTPTVNTVDLAIQPHPLGNVAAREETVFVLEFELPARPVARMRVAQLGLTFQVPGAGYRGEIPPIDVIVEFTQEEALAGRIDPAVMAFVQQRNLDVIIQGLTKQLRDNPAEARKTMELARNMTRKLGNDAMTVALDRALDEMASSKTVSAGTVKTLKIGSKTQTLRSGGSGLPTDEEIRKMTGA